MTDNQANAVMIMACIMSIGAGLAGYGVTGSVLVGIGVPMVSWPVFFFSLAFVANRIIRG